MFISSMYCISFIRGRGLFFYRGCCGLNILDIEKYEGLPDSEWSECNITNNNSLEIPELERFWPGSYNW